MSIYYVTGLGTLCVTVPNMFGQHRIFEVKGCIETIFEGEIDFYVAAVDDPDFEL